MRQNHVLTCVKAPVAVSAAVPAGDGGRHGLSASAPGAEAFSRGESTRIAIGGGERPAVYPHERAVDCGEQCDRHDTDHRVLRAPRRRRFRGGRRRTGYSLPTTTALIDDIAARAENSGLRAVSDNLLNGFDLWTKK